MAAIIVFVLLIFTLGIQVGSIVTTRQATRHLRAANDLIEDQNRIIAQYKKQEDSANWWKNNWQQGDA